MGKNYRTVLWKNVKMRLFKEDYWALELVINKGFSALQKRQKGQQCWSWS